MKKILTLALSVAALTIVCVWGIAWFAQARALEKNIAAAMAAIDPKLGSMKAQSVAVSGFPTQMAMTITNPSFTVHMAPFLAKMHKRSMAAAGSSAGVLTTPAYPESTLDYALAGSVTLIVSALSDKFDIYYAGTGTTQFALASTSFAMNTEYNGSGHCMVKLNRSFAAMWNTLWDVNRLLDPAVWANELREARCDLPGSISTNVATNQILSTLEPSSALFSRTKAGASQELVMSLQLPGYEVLPAGDEAASLFIQAVTPKGEPPAPVSLSLYGKQSLSFDLAAQLPQDMQAMKNAPFRIEVKKLKFASAVGHSEGALLIASNPEGTKQQGEIALSSSSEFTPVQTVLAKASARQIAGQMIESGDAAQKNISQDQDVLEQAIFEALPDITTLGPLNQKLRFSYSGDRATNSDHVQISEFEFSSRDYGITSTADVMSDGKQPLPTANVNLTCNNCLQLAETLHHYLARVQQALAQIAPEQAEGIALTPEQLEGVKGLLTVVGVPAQAAPKNLQFTIKANGGAVDINGKDMKTLMKLVQDYLYPHPAEPVVLHEEE